MEGTRPMVTGSRGAVVTARRPVPYDRFVSDCGCVSGNCESGNCESGACVIGGRECAAFACPSVTCIAADARNFLPQEGHSNKARAGKMARIHDWRRMRTIGPGGHEHGLKYNMISSCCTL